VIPVRLGPEYPPYGGWLTDVESEAWHAEAEVIYERWKAAAPALSLRQRLFRWFFAYPMGYLPRVLLVLV
jgi:hypothetical protein